MSCADAPQGSSLPGVPPDILAALSTFMSSTTKENDRLKEEVSMLKMEIAMLRGQQTLATTREVAQDAPVEMSIGGVAYKWPTAPQQHARAPWRNVEFDKHLLAQGLAG
eukprot:2259244-Prymnesium_polylepis.1